MKHLFKKGNKAWERRATSGVQKIFAHPKIMWEEACGFFQWCEDNPLLKEELKVVGDGQGLGSSVEHVDVKLCRAFTMIGFCNYLGVSESYFRNFKVNIKSNNVLTHKGKSDFLTVIDRIERTIYDQKFTGAAAGLLKENLIARDLGIADKIKNENNNYNSVPMTKDEIKELSNQLDNEI